MDVEVRQEYLHLRECKIKETQIAKIVGLSRFTLFKLRKKGTADIEGVEIEAKYADI
jgi:hypothetical protein